MTFLGYIGKWRIYEPAVWEQTFWINPFLKRLYLLDLFFRFLPFYINALNLLKTTETYFPI